MKILNALCLAIAMTATINARAQTTFHVKTSDAVFCSNERIAAAFRVPAVEVVSLTRDNQWISIRLMEPYWIEWPDEYVIDPALVDEPRPVLSAPDRSTTQLDGGSDPSRQPEPATAFGSLRRFLGEFWRLPESDGARP